MSDPARRVASYQDVLDAPAHLVAEVIDGELDLHPRPAKLHAMAASVLGMDIGGAYQRGRGGPGGWIILDEPELHLEADILVPDLAGWRKERFPGSAKDEPYLTIAPDWVCEILSSSTAKRDRTAKLRIYLREGIGFVWLVDPALRTLEVLRRAEQQWVLVSSHCDAELVTAPPFEALQLELAALWPEEEPEPG
jgi:Uma2 family endonuclease